MRLGLITALKEIEEFKLPDAEIDLAFEPERADSVLPKPVASGPVGLQSQSVQAEAVPPPNTPAFSNTPASSNTPVPLNTPDKPLQGPGLVTDPETGDIFFTIPDVPLNPEDQPPALPADQTAAQAADLAAARAGNGADPGGEPVQSPDPTGDGPEGFEAAVGRPVVPETANGSLLFADLSRRAVPADRREVPAKPTNAVSFTLSPVERARARAAWAYFENNRDPVSGFVRGVDVTGGRVTALSLRNVGSTFAAFESARTLGLISKSEYDFQVRRLLASVAKIERFMGLPTYRFDVTTGQKSGGAAFGVKVDDLAYLMVWLAAVKRNAPYLANAVDDLVSGWSFCGVIGQTGRPANLYQVSDPSGAARVLELPVRGIGQKGFVDKAFGLWGFRIVPEPVLNAARAQDYAVSYKGVTLLSGADRLLYAEPFLQDGLLFDWDLTGDLGSDNEVYTDGWRAELAHRIYQAQLARYTATGIITARASHYAERRDKSGRGGEPEPGVTYLSQPLLHQGITFQNIGPDGLNHPDRHTLSTKAAFAMWALWETPYTGLLFEAVGDSFDSERGFPEGFDEGSGGMIGVYSLETNATVLIALAYNHQGALIPKRSAEQGRDLWQRSRAVQKLQRQRCLPPLYPSAREQQPLACGARAPVDDLDFRHCSTSGTSGPDFSACIKPQAVTNCRFFEQGG